jgi:hypothetical protein
MSLYDPKELERDALVPAQVLDAIDYEVPRDICFYCAKVLNGDEPLVYAMGNDGPPCADAWDAVNKLPSGLGKGWFPPGPQLWLHPDCALALALELIEDYLKVKHKRDRIAAFKELGLPPEPE